MPRTTRTTAAGGFRWLGRGLALGLVLFWGAFFVEHLADWFRRPWVLPPPAWVWVSQALHFGMLVGLALLLRRERLGAVLTVLATTAFLASIGVRSFPVLAMLNLAPIACFAVSWILGAPRVRPAAADG